MTRPDDSSPSDRADLIRASSRRPALPGSDDDLFARDVLEQAWAQVISAEEARTAAAEAYPPGVDPGDVAWNETTIILVALLSEGHRERVRRRFHWSEADLQRRIADARPTIERWRRDAKARGA